MRNLLALLGLATVVFAGVGWWQGWYKLRSQPAADGRKTLNIEVYPNKVGDDTHRGWNAFVAMAERARSSADKEPSTEAKAQPAKAASGDLSSPRLPDR